MINNERVLMRFFHKENELFGFPLSAPPNKAGVTEDESYEKSLFFCIEGSDTYDSGPLT